jgi:hypothetical protein
LIGGGEGGRGGLGGCVQAGVCCVSACASVRVAARVGGVHTDVWGAAPVGSDWLVRAEALSANLMKNLHIRGQPVKEEARYMAHRRGVQSGGPSPLWRRRSCRRGAGGGGHGAGQPRRCGEHGR